VLITVGAYARVPGLAVSFNHVTTATFFDVRVSVHRERFL